MTSDPQTFRKGDSVVITQIRRRGVISEGPNQRGEFLVVCGPLSFWVAPEKMSPAATTEEPKKPKGQVVRRSPRAAETKPDDKQGRNEHKVLRIDLHGLRKDEALQLLEETMNRALMGAGSSIEVIHGLGKGTLKDAVHQYLKSSRSVQSFRLDVSNAGVTWVYL